MTKKQYKRVCRIKVERYSKIITYCLVITLLTFGKFYGLNGYLVAIISTSIWFFIPDLVAYYFENKYKLKHYHTYR